MSSGSPPPTSPDEATQPFQPEAPRGTIGCSRIGLIGCGALVLLLGVAAMVFLMKAGDLFAWAMAKFEAEITKALPEDFSDAERRRLQEAFAGAAEAVRRGEADTLALQRLQERLRTSLLRESGQRLTRDEALELIEVLEAVAAGRPREAPAANDAAAAAAVPLG